MLMVNDRPTRRAFLQGRSSLRELAADAKVATDREFAPDRSQLLASVRRRAMACDWEVQLAASRNDDSMEQIFAAFDLVEALEEQLTVYRDDSEVIRINRRAADGPVAVEPQLFAVLQLAERLHRETDGAIDITSGPLSEAWGFSRRRGRVPSDAEIAAARDRVGMEHVLLDESNRTIAFGRPGVTVNLNCIGKGYALDRMAELLADGNVDDYLLHGGKSSVLARGEQPGGIDKESNVQESLGLLVSASRCLTSGWSIGVRHPLRPAQRLAEFDLRDKALSTSGSGTQFFRHRGRRYGHLLDPRTGWPVEGIHSVTVIAPTAAEADALSTAFYVMGPDKVAAYCAARPEIAALFVLPAKCESEVDLLAFNLDDSDWRLWS
jgi:FAD:protein FMN transferase